LNSQTPYVASLLKDYESHSSYSKTHTPLRNQHKHLSNPNLNGISVETALNSAGSNRDIPGSLNYNNNNNNEDSPPAADAARHNVRQHQLTIHHNYSSVSPKGSGSSPLQTSPPSSNSNNIINGYSNNTNGNNINNHANNTGNNFKSVSSNFDSCKQQQQQHDAGHHYHHYHQLNGKSEFFLDKDYNNNDFHKAANLTSHKSMHAFTENNTTAAADLKARLSATTNTPPKGNNPFHDDLCFSNKTTTTSTKAYATSGAASATSHNHNNNYNNHHDTGSYHTLNKNFLMNYTCSIERYKCGLSSKSSEQWDKPAAESPAAPATAAKPACSGQQQPYACKLRAHQQHAKCTSTSSADPRRRTFFI
jgi:hypothetical protein